MREIGNPYGCAPLFLQLGCIIVALLCLLSCRSTQPAIVEVVRTDTCIITKAQRDTIMQRDSVYVREYMRGDTIYVLRDRIQTAYRARDVRDTIYISKHDTIPYPVEVVTEVHRLWWWQKALIWVGVAAILTIISVIAFRFRSP